MFVNYRRAAKEAIGDGPEATLFASLPHEVRAAFDAAVEMDEFYPATALVSYLRTYARGDGSKLEALGESAAAIYLPSTLTALCVARAPEALLQVVQPLMARFHDWGKVDIEMTGTHEATARLGLPAGFAPEMCHVLGGVARTLLATGGRRAALTHTACLAHRDPSCELRVVWADA